MVTRDLNCTIIRKEIENIEASFCFNFNKSLYTFTVILIFSLLLLFSFIWNTCCTMRYLPVPDVEEADGKVSPDEKGKYDHDIEKVAVY